MRGDRKPIVMALAELTAIASIALAGILPTRADEEPTPRTTDGANTSTSVDNNYRIAGDCYSVEWTVDEDGNRRAERTPLPKANVTLYVVRGMPGVLEEVATTEANEAGHYEFTNLAPSRYDSHAERRLYGVVAHVEGLPAAIRPIFEGSKPGADADVNFVTKSATLSGRLTDADGEPVAGATVFQYGIHGLPVPGVQSAVTNKIGRFRIEGVPDYDRPGPDGIQFRITHPDQPATSVSVPALPAQTVFRFTRGCAVTGTVRDNVTGQPAAARWCSPKRTRISQATRRC